MDQEKKMVKRSIKLSDEDYQAICEKAKQNKETFSSYSRRVLMESVNRPFYTGKEVIRALYDICCDMSSSEEETISEVKERINKRGIEICRILSL